MTRSILAVLALAACSPTTIDDAARGNPPPSEADADADADADTDTDADADTDADTGQDDTGGDTAGPVDADGDGFAEGEDCDDADPSVHPDAVESCNGQDDDCDGRTDEGLLFTLYEDADGDGYGSEAGGEFCYVPGGYVDNSDDCDDMDPSAYPGATEDVFDGTDNDCDGAVDECDGAPYFDFTPYETTIEAGSTAVIGRVYGEGIVCGVQCDEAWLDPWLSLAGGCSPDEAAPVTLHLETLYVCGYLHDPGHVDTAECTVRTSDGDMVSTIEVY